MADIKFTGNVGKDAELKWTKGGQAVLNFSVADSKSRRLESGEWETLKEQWLNCEVWGELAEFYAEKVKRGTRVTVYGEFYARKYEAKDGTPGTSLDVNVKGLDILPSRKGGGSSQQAGRSNASADPWAAPEASNTGGWGNGPESEPPF